MTWFKAEQMNPNDTELVVIAIHKQTGCQVQAGDLLFELEGQKAVLEVVAPVSGFIGHHLQDGSQIAIDDDLYCIADDPETVVYELESSSVASDSRRFDNILRFPKEACDDEFIDDEFPLLDDCILKVAVVPGGKAYRQVEDALSGNHYLKLVGYFDDSTRVSPKKIGDTDTETILKALEEGKFDRIFVATGNTGLRKSLLSKLSEKRVKFVNIIHPTATISDSAVIGSNVFVGPKVIIGPRASIGDGCFFSAFSNVEHHCSIGNNCLFGPGVMLSGSVKIGNSSVLGAGVAVESNVSIGSNVYVSSGKGVAVNLKSGSRII